MRNIVNNLHKMALFSSLVRGTFSTVYKCANVHQSSGSEHVVVKEINIKSLSSVQVGTSLQGLSLLYRRIILLLRCLSDVHVVYRLSVERF